MSYLEEEGKSSNYIIHTSFAMCC